MIATTGKEAADKEEGTVVRETGPASMKGKVEIIIYWDNYYVSGIIFKGVHSLSLLSCSALHNNLYIDVKSMVNSGSWNLKPSWLEFKAHDLTAS